MIKSVDDFLLWWRLEKAGTARGLARALEVDTNRLYYWKRTNNVPIRHWKKVERVSEGLFNAKEIYAREIPRFKAL